MVSLLLFLYKDRNHWKKNVKQKKCQASPKHFGFIKNCIHFQITHVAGTFTAVTKNTISNSPNAKKAPSTKHKCPITSTAQALKSYLTFLYPHMPYNTQNLNVSHKKIQEKYFP